MLGNQPHDENVLALCRGLNDGESLVRGASAWALGRHSKVLAESPLNERLEIETDSNVRSEIEMALYGLKANPT